LWNSSYGTGDAIAGARYNRSSLHEFHNRNQVGNRDLHPDAAIYTTKERAMKKTAVFMMALMLTILVSAAIADDEGGGKVGRLFLFQKCDASGCPDSGTGPWPIIPDNQRWGQMKYNLLGSEFRASFQGKNLDPKADYTLIYYPDPWPGAGLICLGSGTTNPEGNVQINGETPIVVEDVPSGLPASYDANYNAIAPSGAVGAKIWLVLSDDVECTEGSSGMVSWNPASYLFEGNLIAYQYAAELSDDDAEDEAADADDDDANNSASQNNITSTSTSTSTGAGTSTGTSTGASTSTIIGASTSNGNKSNDNGNDNSTGNGNGNGKGKRK
jgi:hypothetical protein